MLTKDPHAQGLSGRAIARSQGMSRRSVSDVLDAARALDDTYKSADDIRKYTGMVVLASIPLADAGEQPKEKSEDALYVYDSAGGDYLDMVNTGTANVNAVVFVK